MKHEYDQRPHAGRISARGPIYRFYLPRCTEKTTCLKLAMKHRFSSQTFDPILEVREDILHFTSHQLPNLREIKLTLQVEHLEWRSQLALFVAQRSHFDGIAQLSEIRVTRWSDDRTGDGTEEPVLAEWTVANGLLVHWKTIEAQEALDEQRRKEFFENLDLSEGRSSVTPGDMALVVMW